MPVAKAIQLSKANSAERGFLANPSRWGTVQGTGKQIKSGGDEKGLDLKNEENYFLLVQESTKEHQQSKIKQRLTWSVYMKGNVLSFLVIFELSLTLS